MKAILTYHSVDDSGSVISVTPSVFERHVRLLASSSLSVVGLEEILDLPDDRDAIAITFDDAFTNFKTEAWPRLSERGFPVTLFVPTGFVGGTNSWAALPGGAMPTLRILDWTALSQLQSQGVTLGAHSRTHADLRALGGKKAVQEEVLNSFDDIQRETGIRPSAFAYPYGHWNALAASVVKEACAQACTTVLRPLRGSEDPHLLPRLDVFYLTGAGKLENFGRFGFRRYLELRAQVHTVGQWVRNRLQR